MNVVIMLLETNCLSLSLAQNRSAPGQRYRCAVVASPGAGQGLARRKRRKEGSLCQHLGLVPSSPVAGPETICSPGSGEPCPQALGSSPIWVVPMSALRSMEHHPCGRELSVRIVASTTAIWEAPSSTPQLCPKQGGGCWVDFHAPGQGCRQSFALLLPSVPPVSSPCIPCSPLHPNRVRALKLEMAAWKLCANMQIISLCCWHEMPHTEWIKAWQLQKRGKEKGVQRGMLSSLFLLLPSV